MPRPLRVLVLALLALAAVPAAALAAASNDDFANAIELSAPPTSASGSTVGATHEPGEPSNAFDGSGPSVWYRFTPAVTGTVGFNTCGSNYDTTLGGYSGASVGSLTQLDANDDYCGLQSSITFAVTAGVEYHVSVSGFNSHTGSYVLHYNYLKLGTANLSTTPASPNSATAIRVTGSAPAGSTVSLYDDADCSGAPVASGDAAELADPGFAIDVDANATTTFSAQTTQAGFTSDCSSPLSYTSDSIAPDAPQLTGTNPPSPDAATDISVQGTAEDGSVVALYATSDCSGSVVGSGEAADLEGAGLTTTVPANSTTSFTARATDAAGNVSECSTPITYTNSSPPANDDFASATVIDSPSTTDGTLLDATTQMGEPDPAGDSQTSSVWYAFTPATTGPVTADLCQNGTIDATLGVYTGTSVDALERVADNDDDPLGLCGTLPRVVFMGYAGTTYHLLVNVSRSGAPSQTPGPFTLTLNDGGTLPDAPTVDDPGTGQSSTVHVRGTAPAGSAVKLYENDDCSGEPVATGTAEQFADQGLAVDVGPTDGTTNFRATDLAETEVYGVANGGYTSSCSDPAAYVRDTQTPAAPVLTGTDPSAPSNATTVNVQGSAEGGSTISIYAMADCGGDAVSIFPESDLEGAGIGAPAAANATTTYSARAADAAGNVSDCSNNVNFTNDSTPPDAPTLTGTDPNSPNAATDIKVLGSAEDGSTVTLYETDDCSGHFATIRSAAELADPGLSVTVAADQTTAFSATTRDAAGNVSNCSNSISYQSFTLPANDDFANAEDLGDAPATRTGSTLDATREPGEPENLPYRRSGSPSVWYRFTVPARGRVSVDLCGAGFDTTLGLYTGTSVDALTPLTYDDDSNCGLASQLSYDVEPGTTYYVSVAGYRGTSAGDFELHYSFIDAPARPTFTSTNPASPNASSSPYVIGNAPDGTTVDLYTTADCSGNPVAEDSAAAFGNPGIAVSVDADTTTTFHATATLDGVSSGCSTDSISYTEVSDSTAPDPPTLTATDPASPNGATAIKVTGTAETGSTVKLYTNAGCTGDPVATGTAADFASPGLAVTVALGSTTTFHASATDAAGNTSGCSTSSVTYVNGQADGGPTNPGGGGGGGGGGGSTPPAPAPTAHPTAEPTAGATASPSPGPASTLTAKVNRSRKAFRRRHAFRVTVSCGPATCTVTIALRLKAKHHRAILLRTRTLTVPANTVKALRFHATAAKRRFVRHHPHLRVTVSVTSPDAATETAGGKLRR